MHEMSIAHSILSQTEEIAKENRAQRVNSVKIRVGVLTGVVEDQLLIAFDMYKKQFSGCEETFLNIVYQNVILQCSECDKLTESNELLIECSHCHSRLVEIIDGQDMILEQVELDKD